METCYLGDFYYFHNFLIKVQSLHTKMFQILNFQYKVINVNSFLCMSILQNIENWQILQIIVKCLGIFIE